MSINLVTTGFLFKPRKVNTNRRIRVDNVHKFVQISLQRCSFKLILRRKYECKNNTGYVKINLTLMKCMKYFTEPLGNLPHCRKLYVCHWSGLEFSAYEGKEKIINAHTETVSKSPQNCVTCNKEVRVSSLFTRKTD